MRTEIKKMELQNFKGIKSLIVNFEKTPNIYGDNATGKTTLFDSFVWCLFGKDSTDRKDTNFNIKTLDKSGNVIHKLEHRVTLLLSIDGVDKKVERVLREKWTKKRGEALAVLSGNETTYFVDDVPMKQKEFNNVVFDIVDADLFKLLSNPLYFNGLKMEAKREFLISLLGEIDETEVRKEFTDLFNKLNGKSVSDYKKELSHKKKLLKTELEQIPTRIDQVQKTQVEDANWEELKGKALKLKGMIMSLDNQMRDKSAIVSKKQNERTSLISKQNILQTKITQLRFDLKSKANQINNDNKLLQQHVKNEIRQIEEELKELPLKIIEANIFIEENENEILEIRENWYAEKSLDFVIDTEVDSFVCPTCLRRHDESKIEELTLEMQGNFNAKKVKELKNIEAKGKAVKNFVTRAKEKVKVFEDKVEVLKKEYLEKTEKLKSIYVEDKEITPVDSKEILELITEVSVLKDKVNNFEINVDDTQAISDDKYNLQQSLDTLNAKISNEKHFLNSIKEISSLEEQEQELVTQINGLEKYLFDCENYTLKRINFVEYKINALFDNIVVRLTKGQINEGIKEICDVTFDGVPFEDLNNAGKINVGLEVINIISNNKNIFVPIFIDNAEASNFIKETESQQIKLYVSKDKELTFK